MNLLGFICLVELALRTATTHHRLACHTAELLSSSARLAVTQAECNMYKAELQRLSKATSIVSRAGAGTCGAVQTNGYFP